MKTQIKNFIIWAENIEINESLKDINLIVEKGELIGITGLNKDEKKELIRILSCFCKPKKGRYIFDYEDIHLLESDRLGAIRTEKIGNVFSSPKLFDELNVMQNVTLCLDYIYSRKDAYEMGREILKELGMEEKCQTGTDKLNNYEKVLVALARGVVNKPILLLVDDTFSWLKQEEEKKIMELLLKFAKNGTAIIVFTDSPEALSKMTRIISY